MMRSTPSSNPLLNPLLAECREEIVVDDASRDVVGQDPLEPFADFDAHLPVARRDEHQDAGVRPGRPDAPGIEQPGRVPIDALAVERVHRHDGNLDAPVAVHRLEPPRERRPARGAQHTSVVADVAGWLRVGLGRDEAAAGCHGGKHAGQRP